MFTGIVQTKASVISFEGDSAFRTLTVSLPCEYLNQLSIGASIAINGVCLTVTQFEDHVNDVVGQVQFDVINETLEKTNLKDVQVGHKVNFERSMTFGTELGGHIVSGHIQTTAKLTDINYNNNNCQMSLRLDSQWMKYVLHKGFVSINGCSLTVGEVSDYGFELHLIPETLNITNLGMLKIGDYVNIEVDQQTFSTVQTVERYMKKHFAKNV
ncbi:MAG: riboflavin synthase subunit alpha [Gammaproteobacteria bacterium]|nr:riboflavin synthase subunit alpha [Gammaproteobacteria bacterium]